MLWRDRGLAIFLSLLFTFHSRCCQCVWKQKASHNSVGLRFKCGFCSTALTPSVLAQGKVILCTPVFLLTKILCPKDKNNKLTEGKRKLSIQREMPSLLKLLRTGRSPFWSNAFCVSWALSLGTWDGQKFAGGWWSRRNLLTRQAFIQ